jgi:hypothetical protein
VTISTAAAIEAAVTRIVQVAPAIELGEYDQLVELLRTAARRSDGAHQALALALARVVEFTAEQLIDPGIALPAIAMACATLADPALTAREFEAARYEIETLLPMPDKAPRIVLDAPDVPLSRLRRN